MAEKENIEKLSKPQLVEMLQREQKLANNRKFLDALPDEGKKIMNLIEKLTKLIAVRDEIEAAASRLQQLNITKDSRNNKVTKFTELDSDDDDDIDDDDKEKNDELSEFVDSLAKIDGSQKNLQEKEKNLSEMKTRVEKQRQTKNKPSSTWNYESAVTPHPYKHQKAKMLPMQESFKLQQHQQKKWEKLQIELAARRLRNHKSAPTSSLSSASLPPVQSTSQYRNTDVDDDDDDDDESDGKEGCYDDDYRSDIE